MKAHLRCLTLAAAIFCICTAAVYVEPVVAQESCNVIEDFNSHPIVYEWDPGLSPQYEVWYGVSGITWGGATHDVLEGSPAMRITDGGWTNGVYAIFPHVPCMSNAYHVEVRMHVVEGSTTDALSSYQIGVAVPGAHRVSGGYLAPCTIFGSYQGLTPGNDTAQGPQTVITQTFYAEEGQDILIAFGTDVTSGSWNGNSTMWGDTYVLVDDIRLVAELPCFMCDDIAAVNVLGPLVEGDTRVTVDGVWAMASFLNVYVNGVRKGRLDVSATGEGRLVVPVDEPLLQGDVVKATQSVGYDDQGSGCYEIESCLWTPVATVGAGLNSMRLFLTLGLRETGTSAAIGADGGFSGPIEWLGATTVVNGMPLGKPIMPSPQWQLVVFDPRFDSIIPYTGGGPLENGNGVLDGGSWKRGVLAYLVIVPERADRHTGPFSLHLDDIASGPVVIEDFEDYPAGTEEVLFRKPRYANPGTWLMPEPNVSAVDGAHGHESIQSGRIAFQLADALSDRWVRLTTYSAYGVPSPYAPNPTVSFTAPIILWILYAPGAAGDSDHDGDVDLTDFAAFQACFDGPNRVFHNETHCMKFDVDADADVDLADFCDFQACFNGANRVPRCG